MYRIGMILLAGLLASCSDSGTGVATRIDKDGEGRWTLTYRADKPVTRLAFARNPDDSRGRRWAPLSEELEISHQDGEEFIRRRDGQPFTSAAFALTPTYTHLPKDYAPFQPFSDGGMLVHSGRFFACADACGEEDSDWSITVVAPAGEHILVKGLRIEGSASWQDGDSGRSFYIGKAEPIATDAVLALVDPGLPNDVKSQLQKAFPAMMAYFRRHLGSPAGKPMLFASYGKTTDGRHGQQGGVLPGEVSMHWYGPEALFEQPDFLNDNIWFLAHEAGHIHQGSAMESDSPADAWIHEGHAELMALLAMDRLFPQARDYLAGKLAGAQRDCDKGLRESSLAKAAKTGRFELMYSCGLALHKAIHDQLGGGDAGLTLWRRYQKQVDAGQAPGRENFLALVAEMTSPTFVRELQERVKGPILAGPCPLQAPDKRLVMGP
ncbi:hypothetical protein [Gallaecimonas sp. GXIMD4217]|uniref:hypothetical protein n=1 Tax=Gallaecimonas sp. GXIMD4217 TaxID=3131927 RepID=UPI00311AE1B6